MATTQQVEQAKQALQQLTAHLDGSMGFLSDPSKEHGSTSHVREAIGRLGEFLDVPVPVLGVSLAEQTAPDGGLWKQSAKLYWHKYDPSTGGYGVCGKWTTAGEGLYHLMGNIPGQ